MDEESAVKAPVTRLRRRLSVEQSEDVKSPGPATPTKKRGGRLAAKPQLKLIDENVPEPNGSAKRSTRKTSVKEIVEAAEEKPVTPSRRSTRIKSNTSLVSETIQSFDSPRAKRAARRTSQVGSDSESSVTPARQTRRTRKDSTSSIEKLEVTLSGKPTQITEVIIEEDNNSVKSDDTTKGNDKTSNNPVRKSPRLKGTQQKKGRKSTENSSNETQVDNKSSENNVSINQEKQTTEIEQEDTDVLVGKNIISPKKTNNSLVDSSLLLVKELDVKHKIKSSNLNKSTSALENHDSFQKKRQRTKSWTITSDSQDNHGVFFSDNEITKKKLKKRTSKGLSVESNHTGSGDSKNNIENSIQNTDIKTQSELDISIQIKNNIEKIYTCSKTRTSKEFLSPNKSVNFENKSLVSEAISPQGNKENFIIKPSQDNLNESTKTFEKALTSKVQSTVYFDDSDADSKDKSNVKTRVDTEDQCVPVIHHLVKSNLKENSEMTHESAKKNDVDNSCEPMDIDETIPNNVSLSEYSQTNFNKSSDKLGAIHDPDTASTLPVIDNTLNESLNKSKRKSSYSKSEDIPEQTANICSTLDISLNESSNKSKRKSSDSKADNTHDHESMIGSPLMDTTLNKSSSKSKRKSSDCKIEDIPDQTSSLCASLDNSLNKSSNKSKRKSSDSKTDDTHADKSIICSPLMDTTLNKSSSKSKRKSSDCKIEDIPDQTSSLCASLDNSLNKRSNKSKRKSSDSKTDDTHADKSIICSPLMDTTLNKSSSKSKRKSSDCKIEDIPDQTSSLCASLDNSLNKSSNKSKRKSSDSKTDDTHADKSIICSPLMDTTLNKSSSKSKRKSSDCKIEDIPDQKSTLCASLDNSLNKSSNKTKRKSSDSKTDDTHEDKSIINSPLLDTTLNKSSNKSKRKSSLSHSHNLEKSETENKTTLILSQIKDVSSTEDSISKSPKPINDILSKSVGSAGPTKETLDKKNLSHDYSTSTPLQQKKFQKLAIQINSSIIDSSNIEYKKEKVRNTAIKDVSQKYKKSETTSEDESDSEVEEESSKDQSGLIDDEAEEASDDYQSGDSQDNENRQYQKENEIVERGETLESDDEVSNDSDYEKDSFVVSSDEEDNDLLSGSGDDLSMSDKELSMSEKSKKKYDERKQKEQKKASREIFEARHKLNTSDATTKAKKLNKRQQIESEEEEVVAPVKRNKQFRLDSTQEEDLDQSSANKSITKNDSKAKRLSESKHNESAIQETEISTVCDKSVLQHDNDPLSVQIKLEPKTPMKDFNISTVQINENIEEVQVDNNASVMNTNETMDPLLQATMLAEEDSSMSENSEIANNYDSILKELNCANKTKKSKTLDTSLNLNKKTKQNPKEPIVDQLILTNTKTSTKKEKILGEDVVHSGGVNRSHNKDKSAVSDAESSDSIDLQLLFSEDSNDNNEVDDGTTKYEKPKETDAEEFIPLKRTPGKMNILTSEDKNELSESTLNESTKKKNKKLKSQKPYEEPTGEVNDNEIRHIIIDTQDENELSESTMNESTKKKNKKRKSQKAYEEPTGEANDNEIHMIIDTQGTYNLKETRRRNSITENKAPLISTSVAAIDKDDEAPLEVPYESTKSKKKNRKSSETNVESQEKTETSFNMSLNTNIAKKKKKRVSESHIESTEETSLAVVQVCNISIGSAKQKKNISQIQITSDGIVEEKNCSNVSLNMGSEKKKKKRLSETLVIEASDTVIGDHEESLTNSKKRKRKSSANEFVDNASTEDPDLNPCSSKVSNEASPNVNKKKKRKISRNDNNVVPIIQDAVPKKKNKKRKERDDEDGNTVSKIFKENSFDKVRITRLPSSVLNELEDKPRKRDLDLKRSNLVSTTSFIVEDTRKRRNNPSKFLEESVYLNDTHIEEKPKGNIKKPKVLPFLPTAVTSGSGFTTNFKINVIPPEVQFVAQTKNVTNFKNEYLYGKKIKRLGTYETYKKNRNAKLSKF